MSHNEPWVNAQMQKMKMSLIGHGALVVLVSLIAGFFLTFEMLQGFKLWPLIHIEMDFPGTVRGWRVAHSGGLLNGVMIIVMALCLTRIDLTMSSLKFVYWSFLLTGWGNTLFYWFGNFSMNRGLSGSATPYGEGDIYGLLAYISGANVMMLTVIACFIIAKNAFSSKG